MKKKILTVGALAALLSGGNAEAIRFDQIKQKAVRSSLVQTGLKAGMDELQAAGVPVWGYFKSERDFLPLIKAKKQGKDPLAVFWAQVKKEGKISDLRAANQPRLAAAAERMGAGKSGDFAFGDHMSSLLRKLLLRVRIRPSGVEATQIKQRANHNLAFEVAVANADPYELANIIVGPHQANQANQALRFVLDNRGFIGFFNDNVIKNEFIAEPGRHTSAEFEGRIKDVFALIRTAPQEFNQNATRQQGGPNQSPNLLLTVTGVNADGYRVSFVNGQDNFQHAFVPVDQVDLAINKPLKIGQLLVAKIDYAAGRQQQDFGYPYRMNTQVEINGAMVDIPIFPGIRDIGNYDRIVNNSIIKGLIPVR